MRILVSAGPTQEPIDSVRFISNSSSGRMGFAIAKAAVDSGHKVTLVLGPVAFKPEVKGLKVIDVKTASEMADAVLKELGKGFDVFVSAAAVADYTPVKKIVGKIKSGRNLLLRLKPTSKITLLAKKNFPEVFLVAFKAEFGVSSKELAKRAFAKMSKERLDLIVANDIKVNRMGSCKTDAYIVEKNGKLHYIKTNDKDNVARRIIRFIDSCLALKYS